MITKQNERTTTSAEKMRGGEGVTKMTPLFDEKIPHIRLLNIIELAPGCSIGEHEHSAEAEVFYVLSGEATVLDHGQPVVLKAGDAHLCSDGEAHCLINNGKEPTQVLAIIPTIAE